MMMQKRFKILIILFLAVGSMGIKAQVLLDTKTKTVTIQNQKFTQVDGWVTVPEDRSKPTGRQLTLPVRIIKSAGKAPAEPVFYLDGGPGNTNISQTSNVQLLQNHDVVYVGYRGVDGPFKLTTKKINQVIKKAKQPILSDKVLDAFELAIKTYFKDVERQGVDLSKYTMLDVIEDVEQVRRTLGYERIHLWSFSYGTRLALLYSYIHPQVIQRSILAGANPPGHFIWYPQKTEEILTLWEEKYEATGKGSLKAAMRTALDHLPKRWSFYRLDADKIKNITFLAMSQNELAVSAFDAFYQAAERQDYSGLYLMQLLYDLMTKKIIWGDMFSKGAGADLEPGTDYRQLLRSQGRNTVLGANLGLLLWGSIGAWDKGLLPEVYRTTHTSQTETLIISGNLDTSTPADFATEKLLPTLPHGHQVILKNMSHADIASAQPEGYHRLVTNFFDRGVVDESGFVPHTIDLEPKRHFHRLAKWGFPLVVALELIK